MDRPPHAVPEEPSRSESCGEQGKAGPREGASHPRVAGGPLVVAVRPVEVEELDADNVLLTLKNSRVPRALGFDVFLGFKNGRLTYVSKDWTPPAQPSQATDLGRFVAAIAESFERQRSTGCTLSVERDVAPAATDAVATVITCGVHAMRIVVVSSAGQSEVMLAESLGVVS